MHSLPPSGLFGYQDSRYVRSWDLAFGAERAGSFRISSAIYRSARGPSRSFVNTVSMPRLHGLVLCSEQELSAFFNHCLTGKANGDVIKEFCRVL